MQLPMKRNTTMARVRRRFLITAPHTMLATLTMGIGIMGTTVDDPIDMGDMGVEATTTVTESNTFFLGFIMPSYLKRTASVEELSQLVSSDWKEREERNLRG